MPKTLGGKPALPRRKPRRVKPFKQPGRSPQGPPQANAKPPQQEKPTGRKPSAKPPSRRKVRRPDARRGQHSLMGSPKRGRR